MTSFPGPAPDTETGPRAPVRRSLGNSLGLRLAAVAVAGAVLGGGVWVWQASLPPTQLEAPVPMHPPVDPNDAETGPGVEARAVEGTVTSVSAGSVVIESPAGSGPVRVGVGTVVSGEASELSEVDAGDRVKVGFTDGSEAAATLEVLAPPPA